MKTLPNGDRVIGPSENDHVAGDLIVDGWLEVKGKLTCDGDVRCLGVSVEPGGEFRCRALTTNLLEVDNLGSRTNVVAERIEARVLKLVQVAVAIASTKPLADLLASGGARADYVHHFGGDLNPSFDYEKGDRAVLRAPYVEPADDGVDERRLPIVAVAEVRAELARGGNPFEGVAPLVTKSPAAPRAQREEPTHPLADDLRAWIAGHAGPQRKLLDDLVTQWRDRLAAAPEPARAAAARIVKSVIKSPKLATERDALIAAIAGN